MKCRDDRCLYCIIINLFRFFFDVFEKFNFLFDYVLGCNGRFKLFIECYGIVIFDLDRFFLYNKFEFIERDKKFKFMFVVGWF